MQLPLRRSQRNKIHDDEGPLYLTVAGIKLKEKELERLEKRDQPRAVEDVSVAVAKGDLSENAEYHEARGRLSHIQARVFALKDQLRRAVTINETQGPSGRVQIGSTVVLEQEEKEKTYQIVGPQETNPSRGRISHLSPLGAALLGKKVGEDVIIKTDASETTYKVTSIE
jgi:transcription elongation factor GreA